MVLACHLSIYDGDGSLLGLKNGVLLFFGLSGYLLYRPFVRGTVDLRRYAISRIARIMPAYLVVLVGVTLLTGDRTFIDRPLVYLLFLQNYDPALWSRFVGVTWTLVIEVSFYVTLPLLAAMIGGRLVTLLVIAAASLLLALELFTLAPIGPVPSASIYPGMLWAFVPGMAVALLEDRLPRSTWPLGVVGIALIAAGAVINAWPSMDLPTAVGSGFLVAWAVAARPSFGRLTPLISAGAAITYSVYLWHVDIIHAIPGPALAVALILAIAGTVYVVVERPAIRLGRRLADRRPVLGDRALRPADAPGTEAQLTP